MKRIYLEIIVFVSGAVVMAFEIIGSRMLGPYVGTSIFVWTSIIGVLLFSLSIGYRFGGWIADRKPRADLLSFIIFFAGLSMILSASIKDWVLTWFLNSISNIKLVCVFSSLLLLALPSVLLGMVSPFAARLKMNSLATSGATVGNLYAISTIGSILGVFLAGFYLIPTFKTTDILFILSITLIATSLFLNGVHRFYLVKHQNT